MALFRFSFNLLLLVCCLWNILGFRSRFAQKLFRRTSQFDVCRKEDLKVQLRGEDLSDESPSIDDFNRGDIAPTHSNFTLPSPYNAIVDVNGERKSLVFELTLTRDLGFEIIQGSGFPIVGKVDMGSKAASMGVHEGDRIAATSATAGDQMWVHSTVDSVQSALSTRFVMSPFVKMRFERSFDLVPEKYLSLIKVPMLFQVPLKRPLGLNVVADSSNKGVFVQRIVPGKSADRCKRIEVGDQIVSMSATWGDRMWEVNSVESFMVGVKMRYDDELVLKIKRIVPFDVVAGLSAATSSSADGRGSKMSLKTSEHQTDPEPKVSKSLYHQIAKANSKASIQALWNEISDPQVAPTGQKLRFNSMDAHSLMKQAIDVRAPEIAVDIFERCFNFSYVPLNEANEILSQFSRKRKENSYYSWSDVGKKPISGKDGEIVLDINFLSERVQYMEPNEFVATTAIKAYGRIGQVGAAKHVVRWLEEHQIAPDIYVLSALLYVLAKHRRVEEVEHLFWKEIPQRGLEHNVVTANSLMYMYARQKRPDDALKVYELIKSTKLQCTVVTYGILVKALMFSNKQSLQNTAFEIVRTLPQLGIQPTIEIFNQMLEYYSATNNHIGAKKVLKLISNFSPQIHLNEVSYGHLIFCYASGRKPRGALSIFNLMRKRGVQPNEFAYMGVLKSLALLRDGVSAVQVMSEMMENGIRVDKNHYSMAIFACLMSNENALAESLLASYIKYSKQVPDEVLCTLWLRTFLQQGKWTEGEALLKKMIKGTDTFPRPTLTTFRTLLKHQILESKWQEAEWSFKTLLNMYSNLVSRFGNDGAMLDGFETLSYALGLYSSALQRDYADDMTYGGGLLTSETVQAAMQRSREAQMAAEHTPTPSNPPLIPKFAKALEMSLSSDLLESTDRHYDVFESELHGAITGTESSSRRKKPGYELSLSPDAISPSHIASSRSEFTSNGANPPKAQLVEMANELNKALLVTAKKTGSQSSKRLDVMDKLDLQPMLTSSGVDGLSIRPTEAAIAFVLRCVHMVGSRSNVVIPSTFYTDLMRALLLEGKFALCQELIELRKSEKIRVKILNPENFHAAEQLAKETIKSGLSMV